MKRASLTTVPTPAKKTEPTDLTDRLLDREARPDAEPAAGAPARPRRSRKRAPAPAAAELAGALPDAIQAPAAVPPAASPEPSPVEPEPALTLAQALHQVEQAAEALRLAGQSAPARYEVAVRYRLDALGHHLRQVAEFVASLAHK